MANKKNAETKIITLDNLKEYTQEFLNKLFPVHHILLTKVAPDAQGYPFLADLIDNSDWLPLEENRMLRIMSNTSLGGGDTCVLTVDQMPSHNHDVWYQDLQTGQQGNIGPVVDTSNVHTQDGGYSTGPCAVSDARFLSTLMATGGSQSHSVLNAYQGIYGWERTK